METPFMPGRVARRLQSANKGTSRLLLVGTLLALGCNSDTTQPPGPPARVAKTDGDAQSWYRNNPLPVAFSVTVTDANGQVVPGVRVDWAIVTGTGGILTPAVDTTDFRGVAASDLALGTGTLYIVTASVSGVPSVTFTADAAIPPVRDSVTVKDNFFQPDSVILQVNDTVYWTWAGSQLHNVTFGPGQSSPDKTTGTYFLQFTNVGKFSYTCTLHAGMKGVVVVVN